MDDDGAIRLWNARQNKIMGSWKTDDRIPYSSMAVRPGGILGDDDQLDLLVANHGIRLLSMTGSQLHSSVFESIKPKGLVSFTGHASSIKSLQWDASQKPSSRFLSMADSDRFIYVWEVPSGASTEGKIILSIPLDSNVRRIALSIPRTPQPSLNSEKQRILALSASGKIGADSRRGEAGRYSRHRWHGSRRSAYLWPSSAGSGRQGCRDAVGL